MVFLKEREWPGLLSARNQRITTTHLEFTMDFSKGKPVGTYKTAEMDEPASIEVKCDWVWSTDGSPNVMELCAVGLRTIRIIIADRDAMNFAD
jgi:hypothetical protein